MLPPGTEPVDDVAGALLGEPRTMRRRQVSAAAEVSLLSARRFWHALGFPNVGDEDTVFTAADLQALRSVVGLVREPGRWWDRLPGGGEVDKALASNADPGRAVNCHVRPVSSPAVAHALAFRDALRADAGLSMEGYEVVVEGDSHGSFGEIRPPVDQWRDAGATWWVESWWDLPDSPEGRVETRRRLALGPRR